MEEPLQTAALHGTPYIKERLYRGPSMQRTSYIGDLLYMGTPDIGDPYIVNPLYRDLSI